MIRFLILAFVLGAAALQTRPALPPLLWAWVLPLAFLLAIRAPRRVRQAALLLVALAAGFFYAAWRADLRLSEQLPALWEGRDVSLSGRVLDLPETTASGIRFVLAVETVSTPGATLPARVQLGWHGRPGEAVPRVRGGDCVQVLARLYRPHGNINPGGFDYEAWLLQRDIRATGGVVGLPTSASACGGDWRARLDHTREAIRGHLRAALGERPYSGVVRALAVGEQDAIPAAQWTLFRQTGVTHLMSISGLHITLFSALIYALAQALWRRLPGLALRLPARKAGALLGFAAAAAYTALAGFGIPAQRTLYMLAGAALVALLDRNGSPSRLLAAALAVVVLFDPWAAFAPGFWLSFGAVAALLWAGSGRLRPLPAWRTWLAAQWAVTLALTPLLLALFHEVSLVSPLANAFAIPLISLVAVPASLLAAVLPWEVFAVIAHTVVQVVMIGLEWLARLPQPVFHAATPSLPALLLALLGAAILLLPRGVPARWLGVFLFLPLLFPRLPAPAPGEAWLTVLDVGQGEALLLRTARHSLLVDAGPRFFSGEEAGSRIVAPYLWSQGINHLDGLILTHDDLDHSGGVAAVLASHRPDWFLTSLAGVPRASLGEAGQAILAARPDARPCVAGQTWAWDGVVFTLLHPPAHHYAQPGYSDNERGCVLRVDAAGHGALLTADIERLSEINLRERRQPLAADVLVAPHHGSLTSSSPEFLHAVAAKSIVIPVGHRNRYGHPHPEVLARYRSLAVPVWRTDRDGAVTLRLDRTGVEVESARAREKRYWRD
ncbi:MAG: DNA internalization-related competence protein ComEC/Rec2 [Gallionellaceae bacterium]|nr:DNA internalization-related competence protein ComEC/Rec2 [Gallionellaceae bacterium]